MDIEIEKKIIVDTINRVYAKSLTTTSGGNLSVRGKDGDIFITPSSKDKGTLQYTDVCRVTKKGEVIGDYKPSIELPFHTKIYELRPDINAVLHVHSPYLVSFSLLNSAPNINIMPYMMRELGKVGLSLYDIPGSIELGAQIAKFIARGYDAVMMQNHGVVLVADTMDKAYRMLETLENCAKICLNANILSEEDEAILSDSDLQKYDNVTALEHVDGETISDDEMAIRDNMAAFSKRCYNHDLFAVNDGAISVRLNSDEFLITPAQYDRAALSSGDIVKIKGGIAHGKACADAVTARLHAAIYTKHKEVNSIFTASPVNIMAYGVTDTPIDSRTIPESYIMMRDLVRLDYASELTPDIAANAIKPSTPVAMVASSCVITTGETIVKAFDRLEVTDVTAKNLLLAKTLGTPINITDTEIDKIDVAFNLPK